MATEIKVPGILVPGSGDHWGKTDGLVDESLSNKSQKDLNALFNQGKGVDENGNIITVSGTYEAGDGLALNGKTFGLDATTKAKLNSIASGVKSENFRGNWVNQVQYLTPLFSVWANSACTQLPVSGETYEKLYVKFDEIPAVGTTYQCSSTTSYGLQTEFDVYDDAADGPSINMILFTDLACDTPFYNSNIIELDNGGSIEWDDTMPTYFYADGKATNESQKENTEYDPYVNTSSTYVTVYHNNSKWLCNGVDDTIITDEPTSSSASWTCLQTALDGKGISYVRVEQALSTSASSVTGNWTTSAKSVSKEWKYLWERTTIVYTDGTQTTVSAHVIGAYGDSGENGTSVTIKGTVDAVKDLPSSDNTVGDGYIIDGYLYVWTTDGTWINAGKIQGESAIQYYIHRAYSMSNTWSSTVDATKDTPQKDYTYQGLCINTTYSDPDPTTEEGFAKYEWQLVKGSDGISVTAQYSADKTSWHPVFATGDIWMRTKTSSASSWGEAMRIVGEQGDPGTNGEYTDFTFAISADKETANSTTPPTISGSWSDAPISTTSEYPYLWVQMIKMTYDTSKESYVAGTSYYQRLTGEKGSSGSRGAILRGPSEWTAGVTYQGGEDGDTYQDLVTYGNSGMLYVCHKTHVAKEGATDSNDPVYHNASDGWTAEKPWEVSTIQGFVATKILFAERGKIENADIKNCTIEGTITESPVTDLDAMTNGCATEELPTGTNATFQIIDISKGGSIFIPTEITSDGQWSTGNYSSILRRNRLLFLPMYNEVSLTENISDGTTSRTFKIPSYQTVGTQLTISVGAPPVRYMGWATQNDYKGADDELMSVIYAQSIVVCADALMFAPYDSSKSYGQAREVTGAWIYGDSTYKHGRFSCNGALGRFILMMPGQILKLVSVVENIYGENCLVWYVANASDYTSINCTVLSTTITGAEHTDKFLSENYLNPTSDIDTGAHWRDCIFAHKNLDTALTTTDGSRNDGLFMNMYREDGNIFIGYED